MDETISCLGFQGTVALHMFMVTQRGSAHLWTNQHLSGCDTLALPPRHPSEVCIAHNCVHAVFNAQQANDDLCLHTCAVDLLQECLKLLFLSLILLTKVEV